VTPNGREKTFRPDQIIVSKTDPQGRLTYVNPLFVEISGYTEAELIGQPHNIIRHPDMPRSVFRLLWERISGGEEIFAYVVNLSADGTHYWVLAHVTPTIGPDGRIVGYHSNRRTADKDALAVITDIYAKLRAVERSAPSTPEALAAGTALLEQMLADAGQTYDELVWSLSQEVAA
jgi:PAS domain S-box-containing protein